ncbi:hypothetical protein TNCT_160651 [Trichonephila clavata]|uniref:Uncharacterized protein n=1 Tax=Trichonephila clavata TaxID=2740835 RepID=A0A8X6GP55_TRICU|nr:hypothetical protein TNCT_160651 [Trichonephila clavata]
MVLPRHHVHTARCMRWGSVMFVPPLTTLPACGRIQKELCIHRPYVLMHADGLTRPVRPCMRWGSVMFVPPRHDIDRPVEEFRTELCIHRPCVLMHAGWSYREPSARCMRWVA